MSANPTSIGDAVSDHHPHGDGLRIPTAVTGNQRRESSLAVRRSHQLIDVDDIRLEFDYDQCSRGGVPGEDVDHPALASYRERHLGRDLPTVHMPEPARKVLVKGRVSRIHQPIQLSALPSNDEVEAAAECLDDLDDRPYIELLDAPTLET